MGRAARTAHRALGCRHYSLFDFRIDPEGRPWFLEAGLYCSFSPGSVVAVMAAAAGMDVTTLFAEVVARARATTRDTAADRSLRAQPVTARQEYPRRRYSPYSRHRRSTNSFVAGARTHSAGQPRSYPSVGNLRVASIPSFPPKNCW